MCVESYSFEKNDMADIYKGGMFHISPHKHMLWYLFEASSNKYPQHIFYGEERKRKIYSYLLSIKIAVQMNAKNLLCRTKIWLHSNLVTW